MQSLTLRRAPTQPRHLGRGSDLVDEDKAMTLVAHHRLAAVFPLGPRLGQFRPVLFACPQSFFEAEPAGNQELRKVRWVGYDTFRLYQRIRQFRHGDVIPGRNGRKDEVPVGALACHAGSRHAGADQPGPSRATAASGSRQMIPTYRSGQLPHGKNAQPRHTIPPVHASHWNKAAEWQITSANLESPSD